MHPHISDLYQQFLDPENFQLAWEKVQENHGCAGVDRQTIEQFERRLEQSLIELRHSIAQHTYRPQHLRQLFIPKKDGEQRMLAVPTVRDRIVQQALLSILHPIFEPHFESSSFAYRPGRSYQMAVQQITRWRDRGYQWLLDADIVKYFDHIQHQRLLAEVQERLPPPSLPVTSANHPSFILHLIQQWLLAGIQTPSGIIL